MNTMKILYLFVLINVYMRNRVSYAEVDEIWKNVKNVYGFTIKNAEGSDVKMSDYNGKVLLIVNVQTDWESFKKNRIYKLLNTLHNKYFEDGFEILTFPCPQFEIATKSNQSKELNANEKITSTFSKDKDTKFSIFDQVLVNGDLASPLWKYLKSLDNEDIKWNYTKFIVNRNGEVVKKISPFLMNDIENCLQSYIIQNNKEKL